MRYFYGIAVAVLIVGIVAVAHAAPNPQPEDYVDGCTLLKIPNCRIESKFGNQSALTMTESPLWPTGDDYKFVDTAELLDVVSTSINDAAAGTGARMVRIIGIADGEWVFEFVTLDGTTPVTTVNEFDFVYRAVVVSAGVPAADVVTGITDSAGSDGDITFTTQSGDTLAFIAAGLNTTQQIMIRVPDNEQWVFMNSVTTSGQLKEVVFRIYFRIPGSNIFVAGAQLHAVESSLQIQPQIRLAPGTDVIVTVQTDTGVANASLRAEFMRIGVGEFPIALQ